MPAIIIDGKAIAEGLRKQIAEEVSGLKNKPGLAVVLVVLFGDVAMHAVGAAFLFVFITFVLWFTVDIIIVFGAVTVHFVCVAFVLSLNAYVL